MYRETHRTTGQGYSVAIYAVEAPHEHAGTYAVQECESAFIPSPTKRLQWNLTYAEAAALKDAWVAEGRRAYGLAELARLEASGTAYVLI